MLLVAIIAEITACLAYEPEKFLQNALITAGCFLFLLGFARLPRMQLGMGDVKFISVIAFAFGLIGTWIVLAGACVTALGFAGVYRLVTKRKTLKLPFAPFLTLGMIAAMIAKSRNLW